ncbi:MAG: zinc ribbon domain-containing protein [Microbacteriaceae bacterium]|nr:zinc ribbon domain-containing protein [Cryobacterium sp.]MCC6376104.1 zinc ribbon domain-containing protein [Microbacteriaceae bacterium]
MNCKKCGSPLPNLALFCGECGSLVESGTEDTPVAVPSELVTSVDDHIEPIGEVIRCQQCESEMALEDIFCGECGMVSPAIAAGSFKDAATREIEPVVLASEVASTPELHPEILPGLSEPTFVLQFSTGESFTVFGTGLIGRNPRAEPSEYVDRIIQILDPGRSVSKTHVEYGEENGRFWIKDRFSGNGTVIRSPEAKPVRCRPDHRYFLERGSRVDIGEQFFVIS